VVVVRLDVGHGLIVVDDDGLPLLASQVSRFGSEFSKQK
jgi:hypothetical protein